MKLFELRPIEGISPNPWEPWYDKSFGFIVRADNETDARGLASLQCSDEGELAWLDTTQSSCVELEQQGEPRVILEDYHAA